MTDNFDLLPPIRVIIFATNEIDERLALILLCHSSKIDMDEHLYGPECISGSEVQKWFKDASVVPDIEIINSFRTATNQFRISVRAQDIFPNYNQEFDKLRSALQTIEICAPQIIEKQKAIFGDGYVEGELQSKPPALLAELEKLLSVTKKLSTFIPSNEGKKRQALWHEDAAYLGYLLEIFSSRCKRKLGLSKPTSPFVQIIASALRRANVTGLPSNLEDAIVQAMKRRKANLKPLPKVSLGGDNPPNS